MLATVATVSLLALLGAMFVLWLVSLRLEDASIVDPFWGVAFAIIAGVGYGLGHGRPERRLLALVLVTLWALRLSGYLLLRRGHGEDHRYAAMRQRHGARFWWLSGLMVFGLQAFLALAVSLPLLAAATRGATRPLGVLDFAGAGLWLAGLLCEAIADAQLARFKRAPGNRGQVMDRGLWRYSRHPNYFGEFLLWWGLGLVGLGAGVAWALLGPALLTVLLLRVSGVTLLEAALRERRPAYVDYIRRTSAFIPWRPREVPPEIDSIRAPR